MALGGSTRGQRRRNLRRRDGKRSPLEVAAGLLRANRALVRALLIYIAGLAGLLLLYALLDGTALLDRFLIVNAQATGLLVALLGTPTQVSGNDVLSPAFSIRIVDDCTSLAPFAVFAAAVLAVQAKLPGKLLGIVVGFMLLFAVNLVRTTSLFYVGMAAPGVMDIAHYVVWQSVMVLLAVAVWFAWMRRYGYKQNA